MTLLARYYPSGSSTSRSAGMIVRLAFDYSFRMTVA